MLCTMQQNVYPKPALIQKFIRLFIYLFIYLFGGGGGVHYEEVRSRLR